MQSMALISLRLAHFRNYSHRNFAFDGRPVAFYGPNGAGKTNILEAISLLSAGRGLRRAAVGDLAHAPGALGWKVWAELRAGDAVAHEVETGGLPGEKRFVRIDGKAAPQTALGRLSRILWLVPAMDRLWIEGAEGRRRFLDRLTLSFTPDHAQAVLHYEKAMRDRNRLLKEQVRDPLWYGVLEARMAAAATEITANRLMAIARLETEGQAASDAGDIFPRAGLALEDPQAGCDDLAALWRDMRGRDMLAGRTLLGPHRADFTALLMAKGMPAAQASTGEQKAILISILLANARALGRVPGQSPLLLLDEVGAHLDHNRRAGLYDAICGLGVQAFMTGTEFSLFDTLGERGQTILIEGAASDPGALV